MSETGTPPISENNGAADQRSAPWIMLTTLLLLISVLILSSATLLHFASGMRSDSDDARISLFDFQRLIEKSSEWSATAKSDESGEAPEQKEQATHDSAIKRFFSGSDDSIRWPKLKLTGFGKSSDAEGAFAIINGKHVLVNTYIDEVKLIEIRTHGAVVEYRGERKYLTLQNK